MNSSATTSFVTVVELCIAQNSDRAWQQFDEMVVERLEHVFRGASTGAWARRFHDFRPWFINWAYHRRVLHAAYRKLNQERARGTLSSEAEQSSFLLNYVAKSARNSALPEFIKESAGLHDRLDQFATSLSAPAASGPSTPIEVPTDLWDRLDPAYRVPFWLRHFRDLGYPAPEDIHWMAAQSGKTGDDVRRLLDDAIAATGDAAFPIGSSLIAELCGISASPDGGQATVDQRVRRARLKLRRLLAAGGGDDV